MPSAKELFLARLEEIRQRYAESLTEKIATVEATFQAANDTSPEHNGGIAELARIAHKLVGSGASFGFPSISEAARGLELACHSIEDTISPQSGQWREIEGLVANLKGAMESAGDQSRQEPQTDPLEDSSGDRQPMAVLLAEGDAESALRLKLNLEGYGYEVEIVGNAADIAKAVQARPPAAIVMELEFDGQRTAGSDAIQQLRSSMGIDCPVIVTTVHDDFAARLAAVKAGCDAFLSKPVAVSDLIHILDSLTSQEDDEPQRILIIDDDPDIIQFVSIVLQSAGMISQGFCDPTLLLEKLEAFAPELILIDLWMPKCSGQDIAAIIRQQPKFSSLPIVFLSSETDKILQMEAMDKGGDDFLTKPVDAKHLVSAIRSRVSRFRGLRDQMVRDSMTGLFNHATTKQMLETEVERARRSGAPLSFAMLDIDHFKAVNDTYGHGIGDVVIKNLAKFLTSQLRRIDIVGRLGGEEFAVILGDTPADRAVKVMDGIRTAFENTSQTAEGKEFKVTFSCGIAEFHNSDTGVTLSDAADQALYEAKNGGRNKVVLTTQRGGEIAPDAAPNQPAGAKTMPDPARQRKTAIVLDDDQAICNFVKPVAEDASFDVEIYTDSSKFPDDYRSKIDLIVLDLNMPNMDGVELIRFLAQQRCEAALIIISGSDHGILAAAKNLAVQQNLNVIGTLRKPLNKATLKELLETAYLSGGTKPRAAAEDDAIEKVESDIGTPELPTVEELRLAIENDELAVHFQPKVRLPEKDFVGTEALARWQHPMKGSIPPGYFIPFAEKHGLIDALTELVLRKICAFARNWPKNRPPLLVSINISAKSFNNLYFPERMANILAEGSLTPANIIVEVTESTLSADPRHMLEILTRLRLKGFQISIDDFGTGHSSLSRLHQLPFNELKIDKSFIDAIQADAGSKVIVKNTIELATGLGLAVIAEGVETLDQMDILEAFGCGFIQGYLISRPLTPEAFEVWYNTQQF